MKTFYSRLCLMVLFVLSGSSMLLAQCGTNTTSGSSCTRSNSFHGEILANQGCGVYTTVTNYGPGRYFRMPVLNGGCYTVQTCGAPINTQLSVFQGTATTGPFSYNDDNGPVCSGTAASVNFVPNFNDYVRVDVRQNFCQSGGTSSITVRVRQNNNLSFTSSSADMCEGQTRTLTATPTPTTAFNAGAGNGGTFTGVGVSGTTFTAPTPAGASQVYTITYTFGYCTTTQNITVYRNPSTADAGADQNVACDATTATLAATAPTIGTGAWTVVSGTGTVTSPTSPTSGVTGLTPGASSTFRWTVTNGTCTSSTDDVVISSSVDGTAPVPDVATLADVNAQCLVSTLTAPTATDNCSGSVTGTTATSLPITAQGTTVVTWTYDDGNGNTSTQNQNIVIDDVTAPVPNSAVLPEVNSECGVSSLPVPSATDNCGGTVTVTNDATLPINTQGTTVVTWTYDDGNGNTSTQTQNVVIDDVTAPVPDASSLPDVTADCEVTALTSPSATDNCGGTVTVTNDATLPISTQGTTVVTWTYDDGNGNTSTQTQNVVITDAVAPVPTSATLADITSECEVTAMAAPTATDNCSGSVTGTTATTFPINAQGTTVVTWTYDDGNGNTSSQTQNVILNDVTAPVPDAATLADVTAECGVTALSAPTATDNCGGAVTVTHDATLPINTQGTTVVTWTYDDGNGNTSTQTQNVVIDDVTAPVPDVATLADVNAECEVTSLTAPTATDNCGGTVTVTNDATLPINTQGTTVVTWTYTDVNGNSSTQTQNVVIDDVTGPTPDVATLADVTAECEVTSLTAPTATDNCGGTVTVTNDTTLPINTQGTTVVTWTYTDVNGNSSTQTQNVVINDVTPPTAVCQDITVYVDGSGNATITAGDIDNGSTDNCGVTGISVAPSSFTCANVGSNTVTLTVTDVNGNTDDCTATVTVIDSVAPTAVCQDITVYLDGSGNATITAGDIDNGSSDNCALAGIAVVPSSFTCANVGANTVTLTVTDVNGNTADCSATVTVIDSVAPTAVCQDITVYLDGSGNATITAGDIDNGSSDNCSLAGITVAPSSFTCANVGANTVALTVTDVNGNTANCSATVTVIDSVAPTAVCQDITVYLDGSGNATITAGDIDNGSSDNCSLAGIAVVPSSFTCANVGANTVTLTVTDANGNTADCSATVTVIDSVAPTAVCQDVTVYLDGSGNATITAGDIDNGSTDNCSVAGIAVTPSSFNCSNIGANTVTLTVTDANGNTADCSATVTVNDTVSPTPDLAALADVNAECEVTSLTAPTATDNCGTVTVTSDATLPISTQGTTVVTWTYDDGNGNTTTQTQNVVIDDVTAPVPDVATLADVTAECEVTALTDPTATDNCGGTVTVTNDATLPISTQGTTVVTWTYTDVNGNASTQTQNVVIDDVTAPVPDVAALADVTAECEITALTDPTATDNCGGTVTVTNDATLPISTQGTTVVTWTYTDVNGNASTQTQNVVIDDVTAPVPDVATLTDVTDECEVTSLTAPTATDNCGGTVTVTNDATLPISTQGTTVVTWTYDDGNGNTSTQTQNVVITDVTAPVPDVATLADVTAECEVTALTDPTATDNCAGVVTVTNDATLPISTQGTTVVTWTYDDGNGNTSTQTQNVVIDDVTAPVPDVATLADVTAECEVTALTDPTATDNCGGVVTVTNDATLPISTQGTTVVTWTYTDVNGNSSTQTQNVVVDDVTAPVADVATLADVTAECEVTALTDPTATDNCGGVVTVTNDATLPISTQGTTVVTWTYTDENGNSSTQTQNVVIDDVTAPVADVATLADVTAECEVTSLTDPTATDNCGGVVTVTNDATLPISTQGTTVVTWTYTDENGNTSTQTQNVVLDDVTAPIADSLTLPNVMAECEVTSLTAPTATDNCAGTVTVTNDATLPISTQGTTVVTWTYDDGNGNTSTQTQNVILADVAGPVADVVSLADQTGVCSIDAPTPPTATDNCAGTVTGTTTTTFPITTVGTTTVTWEYADGNGNMTSQTQDFIISGVDVSTSLSTDGATITANNTLGTYQWIDCSDNSSISGETNQTFTPSANGDYAVIVTEGTCVDTSACVTVSTIGIEPISVVKMTIYPNPSLDGYFTVSYEGTIESIEVLDMLGRTIPLPIELSTGTVDGSTLADGRYIVRVKTNSGYALSEIVIAH